MHIKKIREEEDRTFYAIRPVPGFRTGRGMISRPAPGGKTSGPTEKDRKTSGPTDRDRTLY